MAIKPPSGVGTSGVPPTTQNVSSPAAPAKPVAPTAMPSGVVNPEAIAKALKDYQKIVRDRFKRPLLSGAAGLFTNNVVFPSDLLDPNNSLNDPKYLHLLSAVLGLKELERYFKTEEQLDEEEKGEEDEENKASKKGRKSRNKNVH